MGGYIHNDVTVSCLRNGTILGDPCACSTAQGVVVGSIGLLRVRLDSHHPGRIAVSALPWLCRPGRIALATSRLHCFSYIALVASSWPHRTDCIALSASPWPRRTGGAWPHCPGCVALAVSPWLHCPGRIAGRIALTASL